MAVLQQYRILRLIMILIIVLLTIFLYASYYTNQSAMLVIPAPASNAAAGRLHNTFGLALPSSSSSSSGSIIIDPLLSKASTSKSSASSSQLLLINNNNNHNNNLIPSNDERNIVVAMVVKNENNNGGNTADDNEQREMGDDDNNDIGGGIIIGPPPQPPQPPQNLDSTNSIEMEEKLTKLLLLNSKKDLIDLNPNGDMLIENNDEIDDNNNINKNNNEDNHEHNHNHDDHDDDDDVDVDGGVMGKDENSVDLPNALQNKQIQDDINKSSLLLAAPSLVDVPKQQLIEYAGAAAAADVSNQSQSKSVNTSLNIIAADESSAAAAAASGRIGGSAQMKPKKSVETEPAAAAAAAIIILNNDKTKMEENHRGGGSGGGGGDNNNNNNNHHHSGDGHYPSGSILASAVRIPLHTAPQHQQSLQSNNNTVGIVNKIGGGGGGGVAAAGTPPLNNGKKNDTSTIDGTKAIRAGDLYGSGGHLEPINNELCPDYGEMLRLLIIITSAPAHREARLAIRQTWGHYSIRRDISIAFILGETVGGGGGGQSSAIEEALNAENFMYGDLIRGHFLDSYNNLTLKTISTLEWVTRNCPKVTFILKTDDDMFINVPKLLAFIEKHQTDERVIFGRLAKKWKPIRNKKSKYYVSPQQYYPPIFPAFTTGPAYLMTSDIIKDLYEKSLNQTYLKLEDVFTTGIVAQLINAKRVHVNEFLNRRIAFNPCNIRKAISVHMVKSNEQFDLWKKLFDTNTKCK